MTFPESIQYGLMAGLLLVLGWSFQSHVLKEHKRETNLSTWLMNGPSSVRTSININNHDKGTREVASSNAEEAFSNDCWNNEKIFQLERRAIFSKTWLFVTHICTFQKAGDYRTFEIAGFSLVAMLGKDKNLRVFQNVCRHRAYQVAKKERGSTTVLGCRYHGWSYDTKGKLIKAPEFENVPGFDKSKNSLWEVRSVVKAGLLFVNLDSNDNVGMLDVPHLETVLMNPSPQNLHCAREWKFDGAFNWKIADFSELLLEKKPQVLTWARAALFGQKERRLRLGYNAEIHKNSSGEILTLRLLPKTTMTTVVECCLYSTLPKCAETTLQIVEKAIIGAIAETKILQEAILGDDDGRRLATSSTQQHEINRMISRHVKDEELMGAEIQPAAQRGSISAIGKADDEFCRRLDGERFGNNKTVCSVQALGILDW